MIIYDIIFSTLAKPFAIDFGNGGEAKAIFITLENI